VVAERRLRYTCHAFRSTSNARRHRKPRIRERASISFRSSARPSLSHVVWRKGDGTVMTPFLPARVGFELPHSLLRRALGVLWEPAGAELGPPAGGRLAVARRAHHDLDGGVRALVGVGGRPAADGLALPLGELIGEPVGLGRRRLGGCFGGAYRRVPCRRPRWRTRVGTRRQVVDDDRRCLLRRFGSTSSGRERGPSSATSPAIRR
jgi:hypothetical protein